MLAIGRTVALAAVILGAAAAASAEPNFSADRFKAHVAFLADDLLEGRETGARGHEIAARYVAAQFALMGLTPAGESGSWFQNVPMVETRAAGATPTFTVITPKGPVAFPHREAALLRGPVAGGPVDADAPVVFAGYGLKDESLGVDDYRGLDVKGKVVAVLWGVPGGLDSEVGAHLMSEQARVAVEHGAIGLLQIPTRSLERIAPWSLLVRPWDKPQISVTDTAGKPLGRAADLAFTARLKPEAAAALFDGAPKTLAALRDAAEKGARPRGFALKARVHATVETAARRFTSPEVIGLVEGADPKLKGEYVVMMAHLDHIGMDPARQGDRINNGALDNAAGVATLLETAHAFATERPRPRRSVLFVANTGEEVGLLGAQYFAHAPTVPAQSLVAGVDLDMPVLTYDFKDVIAYGGEHSTISEAIGRAARRMDLALSPDPDRDQATFVRSDHYMLVKAGVPAVMLSDGYANGGKAAWETYLAKHYHQVSDDLTQPILWDQGAKFAKLNYLVTLDLANADEPARWYEGDYFGNLFAPTAPKAPRPEPRKPN